MIAIFLLIRNSDSEVGILIAGLFLFAASISWFVFLILRFGWPTGIGLVAALGSGVAIYFHGYWTTLLLWSASALCAQKIGGVVQSRLHRTGNNWYCGQTK